MMRSRKKKADSRYLIRIRILSRTVGNGAYNERYAASQGD